MDVPCTAQARKAVDTFEVAHRVYIMKGRRKVSNWSPPKSGKDLFLKLVIFILPSM